MSGLIDLKNDLRGIHDYDLLREQCGLVVLNNIAGLILKGEDRLTWLQGQITNDLRSLKVGESIKFCLCAPTGQLEAVCQGWALQDSMVILTDQASMSSLVDRCERMVIMEDVEASPFEGSLLSVQGPAATLTLESFLDIRLKGTSFYDLGKELVLILNSDRCGIAGWDILLPCKLDESLELFSEKIALVADSVFRIVSLESGNPVWGEDADGKTLPPELGEEFEKSHISYTKGCYTGQEVLMRIHSRGHTNRTWMGLMLDGEVQRGDVLSHPKKSNVGYITSAGWSPSLGYIAAAYVRNEFACLGERMVVLSHRGSVDAKVYPMPLLKLS